MKNKNIIYLLIIVTILGFVLIVRVNNKKDTNKQNSINNNTNNNVVIKNSVYIESHKAYSYQIKGIVRNGTNKTVTGLKITADIYDKNDNKIRNMSAYLETLSSGETWAFSIWSGETNYKYKNLKLTYNK